MTLTRYVNSMTRENRWVRMQAIRLFAAANALNRFGQSPRMLLNGPGKSGTHLLSSTAERLPRVRFSGVHFAFQLDDAVTDPPPVMTSLRRQPLSDRQFALLLRSVPNGAFATAHAPHSAFLARLLATLDMRQVLLVRDPRDVVVSYLHFATTHEWHHHHAYLNGAYDDDDERLLALIEGFPGCEGVERRPSIGDVFDRYLPWLDDPQTVVVRFEDLIGPQGGGSQERQHDAVRRVASHLDRSLAPAQIADVAGKVYSRKSYTYRSGAINGWQDVFTPRHREACAAVASDVLQRLGYDDERS